MDPLISAMVTKHGGRPPQPVDRDALAWSGLPHAAVIADPPSRVSVVGHGFATALRRVADRIDQRTPPSPQPAGSRL